jgi:hypothetical protein
MNDKLYSYQLSGVSFIGSQRSAFISRLTAFSFQPSAVSL